MLARLKHFEQPDDVGVLDLLEQVDLLEHFAFAEFVLHVVFLDRLDGHLLPSQLVHSESYLSEGSFSDQLHELVEVEGRGRQLVVLLDVRLDVLDEVVAFLENRVIYLCGWFGICVIVRGGLAAKTSLCTGTSSLRIAALALICRGLLIL